VAKLIGETAGLLSSMTNFKVKIFFIKSNGTGFKADSKIIRYFNFFSPVKIKKYLVINVSTICYSVENKIIKILKSLPPRIF
jgi:hypothetical protein